MKLFARLTAALSLAALFAASVLCATSVFAQTPPAPPAPPTAVKGYTKTLKSGKKVAVKGYTRAPKTTPKTTAVKGYTKTLKSGKKVTVKGYSRAKSTKKGAM